MGVTAMQYAISGTGPGKMQMNGAFAKGVSICKTKQQANTKHDLEATLQLHQNVHDMVQSRACEADPSRHAQLSAQ